MTGTARQGYRGLARAGRAGLVALACLALAACAGLTQTEQARVTALPLPAPAPRPEPVPPRPVPPVARTFGGFYASPEAERRLSAMLVRLAQASDRPDLRYTVAILNSPKVNAFALPDGQLFVTRGLLALVNDEAELAAVLAHEMAHVSARHATARVEASQNVLLGSRVLQAVTGDRQVGQAALVAGAVTLASFSRQQELEADQIGIRTLYRAGFDPHGAARLLDTMDRDAALRTGLLGGREGGGEGGGEGFLATHPSTPERQALSIAAARQLAGAGIGARDRDALLRLVDGMTYGDDPRTGVVRGRTYLHPVFGFTFTAPEGFALENSPRAVIGVSRDGRALRFDTIRLAPGSSLTDALTGLAGPELAVTLVSASDINGLPGATAVGVAPGWVFRFVLVRLGGEVYRFIYAARQLTPEVDRDFLGSAQSFRRLRPEESAAVRPLRLRVVSIAPGDTAESLAARMAGDDRSVERFQVLNGLAPGRPLNPGQRVKLISD